MCSSFQPKVGVGTKKTERKKVESSGGVKKLSAVG